MKTSSIRAVEGGILLTIQEYFNKGFSYAHHLFASPAEAKAYAASVGA